MGISTDYGYYSYYNNSYAKQASEKNKPSFEALSAFLTEYSGEANANRDISSIIAQYDTNGDGKLDESEQEAMREDGTLESLMASAMRNHPLRVMDMPQDEDGTWDSDGSLSMSAQVEMINDLFPPQKPALETAEDEVESIREKIREKMEALHKRIEEETTEGITLTFQRQLTERTDHYERNFWFENTVTQAVQYGA